jgi:pyridoxal/pyridoxine/pyridoxamine kinase
MAYFEDEVLHELEINQVYTVRQLKVFIAENKDAMILSSCPYFDANSRQLYIIESKMEMFSHIGENSTYNVTDMKRRIYIAKEKI